MIRIDIVNDGTGTTETGNYDVYLYLPREKEHAVRVENYDRSQGWKALAALAVERLGDYVAEVENSVADAQLSS